MKLWLALACVLLTPVFAMGVNVRLTSGGSSTVTAVPGQTIPVVLNLDSEGALIAGFSVRLFNNSGGVLTVTNWTINPVWNFGAGTLNGVMNPYVGSVDAINLTGNEGPGIVLLGTFDLTLDASHVYGPSIVVQLEGPTQGQPLPLVSDELGQALPVTVSPLVINIPPPAVRVLPSCYFGGQASEVRITYTPPAGAFAAGFEETVPAGWTVSNISDGGSFVGGKIRWAFLDAGDGEVSYTVTPPADFTADGCFSGVANFDGISFPLGTECLTRCPYHPADKAYAFVCPSCPNASCGCAICGDWQIELCEIVGYVCTWKAGCHDDMASAVRGIYLYLGGGGYCWDIGQNQWNLAGQCAIGSSLQNTAMATANAARELPTCYRVGQPNVVRIPYQPPAGTVAVGLSEEPPAGWTVSNVSDGGSVDAAGKVKWIFFGTGDGEVTYTITPPAGTSGEECFAGAINYDGGANLAIGGGDCLARNLTITSAVSRKVQGAAGAFDIALPVDRAQAGVECRDGGPTQVIVSFDQPVSADGGLDNSDVAVSSGSVTSLSIVDGELTIEMGGADNASVLTIAFPGILGLSGTDCCDQLCVRVLKGDVDANGATNIYDVIQVRNNPLNQLTEAGSFRHDVTVDGSVNLYDVVHIRNVLNTYVPLCP